MKRRPRHKARGTPLNRTLGELDRQSPLLTIRYGTGPQVGAVALSLGMAALFGLAYSAHPDQMTVIVALQAGGFILLGVCVIVDTVTRRITIYSDRVTSSSLFRKPTVIPYALLESAERGLHHIEIRSRDGPSIVIQGKMAGYHQALPLISEAAGREL